MRFILLLDGCHATRTRMINFDWVFGRPKPLFSTSLTNVVKTAVSNNPIEYDHDSDMNDITCENFSFYNS